MTRHDYSHQRAMFRHNGYVCRECEGCGIVYTDIYGDWEILRTTERICEDCGGTGWDFDELVRDYKAVRRYTITAHRIAA